MGEVGEEVKLVGFWASPYCMRVVFALKMKGVRYEYLEEVVGCKSELLLKSNPIYKKYPVFFHAGKPIFESINIVQYIDDVWANQGPPIFPTDPYDRAIARFWAGYLDDKVPPLVRSLRGVVGDVKGDALIEQAVAAVKHMEDAFLQCSKGKSFFGGDSIGYLDIAFGSLLGWIKAVEKMLSVKIYDEANLPHLVQWAKHFYENDIAKEVMPEPDKLAEYMRTLQALNNIIPPIK